MKATNRHNLHRHFCYVSTVVGLWLPLLSGQITSNYPNAPSSSQSSTFSAPLTSRQNPFNGSVAQEKPVPGARPLSFKEVIDLALKNNLGVLIQSDSSLAARGQRW